MRGKAHALIGTSAVLLVVSWWVGPARGQEPPRVDLTSALLVEIRGLRAAMEQLASSNARIQLAVGRLQIQEQRVNALLRQQAEARQRLADAERQQNQAEARLADLQDVVGTISELRERRAIEQEIGVLKNDVAVGSAALQRMRSEDIELAGLASTEQGRWAAINQALDSLEQTLQQR